jgi:hypothetical protein
MDSAIARFLHRIAARRGEETALKTHRARIASRCSRSKRPERPAATCGAWRSQWWSARARTGRLALSHCWGGQDPGGQGRCHAPSADAMSPVAIVCRKGGDVRRALRLAIGAVPGVQLWFRAREAGRRRPVAVAIRSVRVTIAISRCRPTLRISASAVMSSSSGSRTSRSRAPGLLTVYGWPPWMPDLSGWARRAERTGFPAVGRQR